MDKVLKNAEYERMGALSLAETSSAKENALKKELDQIRAETADSEKKIPNYECSFLRYKRTLMMRFLKKQHKSALEEVREHKVDMATYAKQINDEYQTKIRLRMADMRARYEAQLSSGMATLDNLYKSQLNNELKCAKAAHDDVVLMRVRINELESGSSHDAL
nr:CRE-LMN-1 protein [Haemonchus contortus]